MPCVPCSARETVADSPRETTLDARHALDELAPDELRALLHLLESVGVELLEVEIGGARLVVRRDPASVPEARGAPVAAPPPDSLVVGAPAVGIFYRGTEEGSPPLAAPGDTIGRGQVLGMVEVLRMPHPVEAPKGGRIESFLVENGQPVEYGQPLLVLQPVASADSDSTPGGHGA
jgi:biotin carboxyl carrier protein